MFIIHKIQTISLRLRSIQFQFTFICCILLFMHNSHGHNFGDVDLKVNNLKNLRTVTDRPKRHSINQLKNQIKFILNLSSLKNESIDRFIVETFNVFNPDPVYIFELPDSSNRTLVFHRSNFSDISFPNTTSLQELQKILRSSKYAHLFPNSDEHSSKDQALGESFFVKYKQFISSENDFLEEKTLKIVEENVRTEKNFVKFMDELNEETSSEEIPIKGNREHLLDPKRKPTDYSALIKDIHSKDHIGNYDLVDKNDRKVIWPSKTILTGEKLSWDDFGLQGWIGKINEQHDNPNENGTPMRIEFAGSALREESLFPNKFVPILANYDPLALLSTTPSTIHSPPKQNNPHKNWPQSSHQFSFVEHTNPVSHRPRLRPKPPTHLFAPAPSYLPAPIRRPSHRKPFKLDGTSDSWDIRFNISKELLDLLAFEKIKLENITQAVGSKSKWIVTSSRYNHRDEDVFVGRANDPFGHSTKWKLSVASQNDVSKDESDEDGRQKRDVIDLYSMVKCATGCDPLIFKGYGCYCGFLGSGRSVDGIDRCCKMHDYCYHSANCVAYLEYFVPYLWKCFRGRPLCAIDHGEWGGPGSCAASLCECDRALSNCLRHFYCPRKRAVCTSSPLRLLQNILMDV